jgi:AraC family transcriptional regulator
MHAWESIQNTLIWIEENPSEPIAIAELAKIAHLSPFYYQRLFSRLVGKTVMEYAKLRRLAKAADYLAKNQGRIIDVALDFGFNNHETFTRAFKDAYGVTPEDYRAKPCQLSHFFMPDISMNYRLVDENVPLVADGIVLEIRRTNMKSDRLFAGYSIQNPISDIPGIDYLGQQWDRLHKEKLRIPYLLSEGNEVGVSYPGEREDCFTYFSGAEVQSYRDQSEFTSWTMPEGEYIVCSFEAENFYLLTCNALIKARDYMFGVWLPNHNIATELFMAELYFDILPESTSMEIWAKIKRDVPNDY